MNLRIQFGNARRYFQIRSAFDDLIEDSIDSAKNSLDDMMQDTLDDALNKLSDMFSGGIL